MEKRENKIDWQRKLASFVSMLVVALGGGQNSATQISALIMAGASVIGYVIGEGLADGGNKKEEN